MTTTNIDSCGHIGLFTNNLKTLMNFYVNKLNFVKVKQKTLPGALVESVFELPIDYTFVTLRHGSVNLELFEPVEGKLNTKLNKATGYNHWGFWVDNHDTFIDALKQRKVNITEIDRADHTAYFVQDPDNNRIEITNCDDDSHPCWR